MELVNLVEATAYLSSQIDELRAEQREHNKATGESLQQWSQINADLMDCLMNQSEDYRGSVSIQQALAQHLLTLAETTQTLTMSTKELESSSGKLTLYLEEEQSLQLSQLDENNKQLKASSESLEQYLVTEQAKRLSMLENGLRSLLAMIENSQKSQHPMIQSLPALSQKKQNFDLASLASSIVLSSATTACLLLSLWQFGGVGNELTRISERSEWSMIKLERIESVLGLR